MSNPRDDRPELPSDDRPELSGDDRPELSRESEAFVEGLREGYAPEAPSPARAQAFDAALHDRLDAPQRQPWLRPALVTAAAAAAIGWLLMPASEPKLSGENAPTIATREDAPEADFFDPADPSDAAAWEAELLGASEIEEFDAGADDIFLPDEYQAIAGLFLDG